MPTIQQLLHVQDQKSANTDGGTASTGDNIRALNTIVVNEISAGLLTNQITLPAGTYMCRAVAPAYRTDGHRAYLWNVSDSSVAVLGSSNYTENASGNAQQNFSMVNGRFTISSTKTFELRHSVEQATGGTFGWGIATNNGQIEVYSEIIIWKIVDDFPLMHVRDEKSSGVASGGVTGEVFTVRTLNTIIGTNEITGASLAANTITLPSGSYYVFLWAPMFDVRRGKAHLYNKDDATYDVVGSNMYARSTLNHQNVAVAVGYFEISVEKDFEVRHWCFETKTVNGLGEAVNDTFNEVYTEVLIKKIV